MLKLISYQAHVNTKCVANLGSLKKYSLRVGLIRTSQYFPQLDSLTKVCHSDSQSKSTHAADIRASNDLF